MPRGKEPRSTTRKQPRGRRALAADGVFDAIAGAILRGKYPPESALPAERELAALFNVSRLIVRQALHRLREMGLVTGGQGGQNTVLDPDASSDPRVVALTMQLAPEKTDERAVVERQLLGGAMLLELAQRRITTDEIAELDAMVSDIEQQLADGGESAGFESRFWLFIAGTTRNKILLREARWWFSMLQDQPERQRRFYDRPELRVGAYRAIVECLRQGQRDAAARFLATVAPLLEAP